MASKDIVAPTASPAVPGIVETVPENSVPSPQTAAVELIAAPVLTPLPAAIEAEADDYTGDTDSALGVDENGSSTHSINSSIRAYRQENGRTYHTYKEGAYYLPNDEEENDRLDLQHHLFALTFSGALIIAPIPATQTIHRVLDIGTGTGVWAIDWADEHPESQVIGIDLSPIQPEFVPPNCRFEVDDVEESWTYHTKFDLIHSRMMTGCLRDWPKVFAQALEHLNPGGWIQMTDISPLIGCVDDTLSPTCALVEWVDGWCKAAHQIGRPGDSAHRYKAQLEEAGFVDVVEVVYKWPTNTWPRDIHYKTLGMWSHENLLSGMQAISLALFTRVLGWSQEQLEVFLVDVRKDLGDKKIHAYWPIYVVYGRKPE